MTTYDNTATEPTAVDHAHGMATRLLAALNVCADLDIKPVSVATNRWGEVDLHLVSEADVDIIADTLGLPPEGKPSTNYARSGEGIVYGHHTLQVTCYCGRTRAGA